MKKRLLVVFILGFSSGLPLALVSSTLQAWFSSAGLSIAATAMLSLLGLPYVFRMVWGPVVDRYSLTSLGRRRSWIILMQGLLLVGFNGLAWLSPDHSPALMVSLAFVLACFSATQDVAIDAQRTEYLLLPEQGAGVSLAITGYRLALLIAGGLALVSAEHFGWAITYRLMGFLMGIGLVTTLCSAEPSPPIAPSLTFVDACVVPVKALISRPYFVSLLGFIFFYKLGEAFTTTTSGIVMPFFINGLGLSLDTIGYVNKIMGVSAIVIGGLLAGVLLVRWSLYYALLVFGLLQAMANLLFVALASFGAHLPLLSLAVICDNVAAGMGSTALVVLLMRLVDRAFTATQLSLLIAFSTLPRVLSGPIAATLQSWVGWIGLYQLSFILALGFIPFLRVIREVINIEQDRRHSDACGLAQG